MHCGSSPTDRDWSKGKCWDIHTAPTAHSTDWDCQLDCWLKLAQGLDWPLVATAKVIADCFDCLLLVALEKASWILHFVTSCRQTHPSSSGLMATSLRQSPELYHQHRSISTSKGIGDGKTVAVAMVAGSVPFCCPLVCYSCCSLYNHNCCHFVTTSNQKMCSKNDIGQILL